MTFGRKLLSATALAMVFAGATAIGGPAPAQAEAKAGGTLVIGSTQKPRHLNPAVQSGIATAVPGTQLFATPLRFDANWKPQPYLAEKWEVSDNGLDITLHLRKNATFHDGKPVTSEDLAFSLETVKANHPFKTMFAPVTSVETPDAHTAIIHLAHPHPAILLAMSSALLPVIPKHVYGDGQDLKTHPANSAPVGSGPFRFVEFNPGENVILEKNPDYFIEGRPYLDKIIIKNYKDTTSLTLAMDKGEIDMYPFLEGARNINRLKENKDLTVTSDGYAAVGPINWLAFNTKREILAKKEVRQAIAYAVDRNFITKALHAGASTIATGPITPASPFYTVDVAKYDLDLDKSKAMLDAAGYPEKDGARFSLTIDYIPGGDEQQKNVAEYIASQLKKIGIDLQVRAAPDFPTWAKRVSSHDFDLTMDIVFNWGDPVIGVHRTYLSTNIIEGVIWSNTQSYANSEVDKLLDAAAKEPDEAKRKADYVAFQKIVADDLPIYWLNLLPYHTAYSNRVGNPPLTIWGTMAPMDEVYLNN
ncbi:ABC transporter substrate-binding protein [Oceanibacterium hippocampi]|uniref:Oligopeptide-binding protein AppA n=1 Tax=Oceanibacterium hippocampi TaxID=745714 RepID=A0A1Y5U0W6_9PROT|nr:ABC transporter substrate-binding protein [Oceanibacterium hippocampi]SLN76272.1 Oligopeptide-binding protein AppA precursor [Oceanibacterium hippocampi]